MSEYKVEIRQLVDFPRCRIYRQFIQQLIGETDIRVGSKAGLFHYTVLCCYANFRTSYKRIDGIGTTGYWTIMPLARRTPASFSCPSPPLRS